MPARNESPEDALITPMDKILDQDFGPLPVGPNGQFKPVMYETEPLPPADEENMVCLRGPCRFYMEQKARFNAGNTAGTLDHDPIITRRACMRITGYEMDLTDENFYDCNAWDPLVDDDLVPLKKRRDEYWAKKEAEKTNG